MVTNEEAVDLLNDLIQVNEDRKLGYQKARENLDDLTLKTLFDQYSKQSGRYIVDLGLAVESFGGVPIEKTTIGGDVHRAWMDVKDVLSTNIRKTVLESCEGGEDAALRTYKKVVESGKEIERDILNTITLQRRDIQKAHDHIKDLRDSA
ncbi:MAG TPA: PA2169 family four-helix-bundle protein [Arachidicoccus sp.]|nr:PA2169 family four-helix-bundle protein [Arachidicoccus sp.]